MTAWNLIWILPLAWVVIGGSLASIVLRATSRPSSPPLNPDDLQALYDEYTHRPSRSPFRVERMQG